MSFIALQFFLAHMHPWVKGIQFYTNEGPHSFPRGDNNQIAKIHLQNLKTFSQTTRPISPKLGTKHPWVKGGRDSGVSK